MSGLHSLTSFLLQAGCYVILKNEMRVVIVDHTFDDLGIFWVDTVLDTVVVWSFIFHCWGGRDHFWYRESFTGARFLRCRYQDEGL